jgi:hypothetical protein
MIVQFTGGGPAQGLFKNTENKDVIRVGTPESLADGMAAFYTVTGKEEIPGIRKVGAVATYSGMQKSAASLIDFVVDPENQD